MFELALFNKSVIKRAKSGPVMSHRQAIFTYLSQFLQDDKGNQASGGTRMETLAEYKLKAQFA